MGDGSSLYSGCKCVHANQWLLFGKLRFQGIPISGIGLSGVILQYSGGSDFDSNGTGKYGSIGH